MSSERNIADALMRSFEIVIVLFKNFDTRKAAATSEETFLAAVFGFLTAAQLLGQLASR